MIFKTIDDDSALFGQRIVSIFNARKIAQEQATMQLEVDIACLKQYEVACQSGTVTTEQFDSIMEKSSVSAQQYAINIQNGTGSAKAYAQAQKANNVALQSVGTGAGIASKPNVNIQFNVDGNVDSVTWDTIKKEIPNISKQVQNDIYVDLKKSGALRK